MERWKKGERRRKGKNEQTKRFSALFFPTLSHFFIQTKTAEPTVSELISACSGTPDAPLPGTTILE